IAQLRGGPTNRFCLAPDKSPHELVRDHPAFNKSTVVQSGFKTSVTSRASPDRRYRRGDYIDIPSRLNLMKVLGEASRRSMVPRRKQGRWSAPFRSDGLRLFNPLLRDSPCKGTAIGGGTVEEDRWPPQADRAVGIHPPQRRFQVRGLSVSLVFQWGRRDGFRR
ncbi:hypothetical protein U1Q18_030931, partial [Sarracenia purpurea var. burkii]